MFGSSAKSCSRLLILHLQSISSHGPAPPFFLLRASSPASPAFSLSLCLLLLLEGNVGCRPYREEE